jgi:hypothetical protein
VITKKILDFRNLRISLTISASLIMRPGSPRLARRSVCQDEVSTGAPAPSLAPIINA